MATHSGMAAIKTKVVNLYHITLNLYSSFNHLTPNDHFSGRTAQLTSRCCIFYLFNKYMY